MSEYAPWEGEYGFCGSNETERLALAKTLEAIRRTICTYGGTGRCDCKYGLTVTDEKPTHEDLGIRTMRYDFKTRTRVPAPALQYSEQTGCPELRETIHRLLHRDLRLI